MESNAKRRGSSTSPIPRSYRWLIPTLYTYIVLLWLPVERSTVYSYFICDLICYTYEITVLLRDQCTVPQNVKLHPMRKIFFDLVKACEGVSFLCFLDQIVTWQYIPNLLDSLLKLTMLSYKWWWLTVADLSIEEHRKMSIVFFANMLII